MSNQRIDLSKLTKPERLLWSYGITSPAEIDLEVIALDLGATVRYLKLDGCDARIVGNDSAAIISINSSTHPARQRFSLAHEIGHWFEDRGKGVLPCSAEDIGPQNAQAKSKEALANSFASQLILPSYLFTPRAAGYSPNLDTASNLASEFNASLTATAIKLAGISLVPTMAVCHSQIKREWFFRNDAFSPDMWPLRELHHDTEAFELLFKASSGKTRIKHESATRWLNGPGVSLMQVKAQSVKLPDGTVLSLFFIA
jgi:Zn-dependent peptidase ImmA (M78 family)